jgi:prepilin-type N-terminal cleavage/methylation domain-containing protein
MRRATGGFTLVEVLVAVVVMGIGITALVGSSAMVTRMVGRGKSATRAAQVATQRLEALRVIAYRTNPKCTDGQFVNGGPVTLTTQEALGITEKWLVENGPVARVRAIASYRTKYGVHADTLETRIEC